MRLKGFGKRGQVNWFRNRKHLPPSIHQTCALLILVYTWAALFGDRLWRIIASPAFPIIDVDWVSVDLKMCSGFLPHQNRTTLACGRITLESFWSNERTNLKYSQKSGYLSKGRNLHFRLILPRRSFVFFSQLFVYTEIELKGEVGKQECTRLEVVDNMHIYCERRDAATAGNVGYRIKKARTRVLWLMNIFGRK